MIHIWANTNSHPWYGYNGTFTINECYTDDSIKGYKWIEKLKNKQPNLQFGIELLSKDCGYETSI
jgi:hypothetical protein